MVQDHCAIEKKRKEKRCACAIAIAIAREIKKRANEQEQGPGVRSAAVTGFPLRLESTLGNVKFT